MNLRPQAGARRANFLLRSKRARVFIGKQHPQSQTEAGLTGRLVILSIVSMASFIFGAYLLIDSIIKLAR